MMEQLLSMSDFVWELLMIPYVYGPVLGMLLGLGFTQGIKHLLPAHPPKLLIRATAFVLAAGATMFLVMDPVGVVEGLVVGFLCSPTYQILVWRLYQRWPRLEKVLSKEAL